MWKIELIISGNAIFTKEIYLIQGIGQLKRKKNWGNKDLKRIRKECCSSIDSIPE